MAKIGKGRGKLLAAIGLVDMAYGFYAMHYMGIAVGLVIIGLSMEAFRYSTNRTKK